jgi:CHASE2 domain-containing sensor protein
MRSAEDALAATMGNRLAHLKAVQTAREQVQPSFPTPLIAFGGAIGGAAILAVCVILLGRMLDRTISSSEDVQKYLGLPVQAVIPEIVTPRQRAMRRLRNWTLGPLLVVAMAASLALASMSLFLRLQDPPSYRQWVGSPAGFLRQQLGDPLSRLVRNM